MQVASIDPRSVTISWSLAAFTGNAEITASEVQVKERSGSSWLSGISIKVPSSSSSGTVTNSGISGRSSITISSKLRPNTWYETRIRCENDVGSSDFGPSVAFRTDLEGKLCVFSLPATRVLWPLLLLLQ